MQNPRRVAVVCDFGEEEWPSMDISGQAVVDGLTSTASQDWIPFMVRPRMRLRFCRGSRDRAGYSVDRLLNRHWDYPRFVRRLRPAANLFHVVDHSYAQLVHALPESRTVVTCHDTDTFRCLTHPEEERRSWAFKLMTRRTLSGLQKASRVVCDSAATRAALEDTGLVSADRTRVVPLPVQREYSAIPDPDADREATQLLAVEDGTFLDILHVGSTIQRKRIDVLLEVVARVRAVVPRVRLVRVGGEFTTAQEATVARLGLAPHLLVLPKLALPVLAAVYRKAAIVVLTPEREGFCLPIVEALASGTPVVATDLAVLREVGGDAIQYCALTNVPSWVDAIKTLLCAREARGALWLERRERGLARARRFSVEEYGRQLIDLYAELT